MRTAVPGCFGAARSRRPAMILKVTWVILVLLLCSGSSFPAQTLDESSTTVQAAEQSEQASQKPHRKRQNRPIKLGSSGGNMRDTNVIDFFGLDLDVCCGGTLGALVRKNERLYVLSNNHILARTNKGKKGEPIIQPGFPDQGEECAAPEGDIIGELAEYKKLKFGANKRNRVDAALARVREGAVDPTGKILRIGVPGKTPVDPEIGLMVKKMGRTTGLRRGVITAVNATMSILIERKCGSSLEFDVRTAVFKKVLIIESVNNKAFAKTGDSGSLVVAKTANCPPPVGLLFAATFDYTMSFANPIANVQRALGKRPPQGAVEFVGCHSETTLAVSRQGAVLSVQAVRAAERVQERVETRILNLPGVIGIAVGRSSSGPIEPVIKIFVTTDEPETQDEIPSVIDGFRTEIVRTGPFGLL